MLVSQKRPKWCDSRSCAPAGLVRQGFPKPWAKVQTGKIQIYFLILSFNLPISALFFFHYHDQNFWMLAQKTSPRVLLCLCFKNRGLFG